MAEFQIVKCKVGKTTFEVITKPGSALKYKKGQLGFDNVLMSDEVFTDYKKGQRPSAEELNAAFGTSVPKDAAKAVVDKGDVEMTAAERKEAVDRRRAEIVNYIHKYYIDPKAKTPHPVVRIENALDTLKVKVDPEVAAERQVQDIVKRLPEVMPIKKSEMGGKIIIPHKSLGSATGIIKKFCQVQSESYGADGATFVVTFVPGDYNPLTQDLAKVTGGEYQLEMDGAEFAASSSSDDVKGKKGGAAKRGGKATGKK
eukprot:TRINITY_DN8111_c0_g1_i1.p2 TRINITY_DN8111_c0_g1~~TRINITY_DN8111_c0_g1_i1.p2  ORF type:complete len:266 (+),score=84.42 TRINITY_DN8111_c0_g1_i1:30-800(+)